MARVSYRKAGTTEPEEIVLSATGLDNLNALSSAVLYMRDDDDALLVDGHQLTVKDSATRKLEFDPANAKVGGGNPFDTAGTYHAYIKTTWSDGDVQLFPDEGLIMFIIEPAFV